MEMELKMAILGIIGTIFGTELGWVLNSFSKSGKLNIYIQKWEDTFQYNDKHGFMTPSLSIEQTEYYSYVLELDLYNSSGETKIMRNTEILFIANKEIVEISVPHDDALTVYHNHFTS